MLVWGHQWEMLRSFSGDVFVSHRVWMPAYYGCFVCGRLFRAPVNNKTAAFLTQKVQLDDATVKFEIWDTAGQERYRSLAPMYYRGAAAAIVVYDVTNKVRTSEMEVDGVTCSINCLGEVHQWVIHQENTVYLRASLVACAWQHGCALNRGRILHPPYAVDPLPPPGVLSLEGDAWSVARRLSQPRMSTPPRRVRPGFWGLTWRRLATTL